MQFSSISDFLLLIKQLKIEEQLKPLLLWGSAEKSSKLFHILSLHETKKLHMLVGVGRVELTEPKTDWGTLWTNETIP